MAIANVDHVNKQLPLDSIAEHLVLQPVHPDLQIVAWMRSNQDISKPCIYDMHHGSVWHQFNISINQANYI